MKKKLDEVPLSDDSDVHWDYLYVADGNVVRSDIKGTVRDLKKDLKSRGISCNVITTCDIFSRIEDIKIPIENIIIEKPKYKPVPRDSDSYFFIGNNRIKFKKIEWYEDTFWNKVVGVCGNFFFEIQGMDKFSPKKWISDQNYGDYFTIRTTKKVDLSKLNKINLD